jgi:hypothetical protein
VQDVPCQVKPFLRSERILVDRIGKENSGAIAGDRLSYANGFAFLTEGLDTFRPGVIVTGGKMNPSGNLSFTKKKLWLDDVWKLNPGGMGSLWLKASVEGLHDWGKWAVPVFFSIMPWHLPYI